MRRRCAYALRQRRRKRAGSRPAALGTPLAPYRRIAVNPGGYDDRRERKGRGGGSGAGSASCPAPASRPPSSPPTTAGPRASPIFAAGEDASAAPLRPDPRFRRRPALASRARPRRPRPASPSAFDDMAFGHALARRAAPPRRPPGLRRAGERRACSTSPRRIAASDATVLLLGETGTGKEGLARYIHAASPRARQGPFTAVNCAALPETMLEAMLFGHRKGASPAPSGDGEGLFRAADGGTLLLDEIAELPLAAPGQAAARAAGAAKSFRSARSAPSRSTSASSPAPIATSPPKSPHGRFRSDLYWRLNVMPVNLPPLRARRLDIRAIAAALLLRHCPGRRRPSPCRPPRRSTG